MRLSSSHLWASSPLGALRLFFAQAVFSPRPCAGTLRFKEELSHGANAGLDKAVAWLEPVEAKHPRVSFADLSTYAGAVAIEAMGGPYIPWRSGRVDTHDASAVTPDGRLPAADRGSPPRTAAGLRETFGRMGFGDREIVALSGAHALGRCHAENSGYVGPWQGTPTIFSNIYYKVRHSMTWHRMRMHALTGCCSHLICSCCSRWTGR